MATFFSWSSAEEFGILPASMHRFFITLGLLLFGIMSSVEAENGKLVATEYSPIGSVGSMVGIHVDNKNRVHVTHTYRRNNGALDIRRHRD